MCSCCNKHLIFLFGNTYLKRDPETNFNDKVKTLQETHAEETQALKTDKAKMVSEQEMLQGKSTFNMFRQPWS